ncbi:unnamed protein product [Psylliodes chrysocephalus]|uniref:Uncharacterized protein n=1 Tax=Psylliodes chrysocephalus TaxID=3402493 RepID=A0A9P0CXP3_9CUCU|nr:unnamed protein product [Psylliodes chrysocephala]
MVLKKAPMWKKKTYEEVNDSDEIVDDKPIQTGNNIGDEDGDGLEDFVDLLELGRQGETIDLYKTIIMDKETIIKDQNTIIELLNEKIKELEKNKKTFADAVSLNSSCNTIKKQTKQYIPINPQNSESTMREIQNNIQPNRINVSINSINTLKNGNVVIKCETQQGMQKLVDETQIKLGTKYRIETLKINRPRIKIISYSPPLEDDELEEIIKSQNEIFKPDGHFKITYIRKTETKNKTPRHTIFAECSGTF